MAALLRTNHSGSQPGIRRTVMDFQDKVVVITGGGGGIGKAAARRFLDEGARVVLNSRRQSVLEQARAELDPRGERVALVAGDASVPATARQLVAAAVAR